MNALDQTCVQLVALARSHGLDRIELTVRPDGRVDLQSIRQSFADRTVHADTIVDSELPVASLALQMLTVTKV